MYDIFLFIIIFSKPDEAAKNTEDKIKAYLKGAGDSVCLSFVTRGLVALKLAPGGSGMSTPSSRDPGAF